MAMQNQQKNGTRTGWPVLALLLLPLQGLADCVQTDLTGTWFMNGVSAGLRQGFVNETSACKLRFGSDGALVVGSSSCVARTAFREYAVDFTGGQITLNSFCRLVGRLPYCTEDGFCSALVLDNARMDSGKTAISFLGYAAYAPSVIFDWTGVKR